MTSHKKEDADIGSHFEEWWLRVFANIKIVTSTILYTTYNLNQIVVEHESDNRVANRFDLL
jgi:hypothetical protein